MMKVLIAEDDRLIRNGLGEVFAGEGFEVLEAFDGERALESFRRERPSLVCLDIMMPKMSGYELCRAIRQIDPSVPLIFITAKTEEIDKVLGLELGADDYIVKPFGVRELIARVRAILRRCGLRPDAQVESPFTMGDLTIYPNELRARRDEQCIELSRRDVQILRLLYDRKGQVVDRATLFCQVWGVHHVPNSRTVDQHISQLRKRIEKQAAEPQIISTVHGVGYRYDA